MGLGFILPFALVFVAIPLENFVQSLRTVLGMVGSALLRTLAFFLRALASGARYLGSLLVDLYDLLIFAPLWVESMFRRGSGTATPAYSGAPGGGRTTSLSSKGGSRSGKSSSRSVSQNKTGEESA